MIGTPITRVPIMAKQPLDLYKLFKLVVERGGLVEVSMKWFLIVEYNRAVVDCQDSVLQDYQEALYSSGFLGN